MENETEAIVLPPVGQGRLAQKPWPFAGGRLLIDDPSIDTTSRTGKLIMGILALIAEFENDIRRERQQDGINKAKAKGVRFGPKPILTAEVVQKIKELRVEGLTVPEIIRRTKLSKASIYRALA